MQQPSNLLEHVAGRIARAVFAMHTKAEAVTVDIRKVAAPMSADFAGAGVRVRFSSNC